jgi:hypothetical protein
MLGAGGAARGALQPFLEAQPAELVLLNRTVEKAETLVAQFARSGRLTLGDRARLGERPFDIVVNATSASLFGQRPEIADGVFRAANALLRARLWQRPHALPRAGARGRSRAPRRWRRHARRTGRRGLRLVARRQARHRAHDHNTDDTFGLMDLAPVPA